jgi:hypothetical protein
VSKSAHLKITTNESPALERRNGDHAMTNVTTKSESFEPAADTGIGLFDNWFDPIESGVRGRVREFIEGGFLLLSSGPYPDQKPRGSLRVCW